MHSKEIVYAYCCTILEDRIRDAEAAMDAAQDDSNSETKSSAGDKYETGRAMAQLEKERHARRKSTLEDMLIHLRQTGCSYSTGCIAEGSLVVTNLGVYFLSVGLGSIELEGQIYHCLSLQSPFGQALLELEEGDEVNFRGRYHLIRTIS